MRNLSSTFLAFSAAAAAAFGVWSGGCGGDEPAKLETSSSTGSGPGAGPGAGGSGEGGASNGNGSGNGNGNGSGSGGDGAVDNHGDELFAAMEEDMMGACGACHDAGGVANTPFLAGPDRYATISSWPDIVKEDWESSVLLSYPVSGGGHSGVNLDSSAYVDTLYPKVQEWLEEEARGFVQGGAGGGASSGDGGGGPGPVPTIEPFKPILGFNAIYLTPLDEDFTGMAITFNAEELTETTLQLSDLEMHTTAADGLHIVHPLFVVWPVGAEAQPDPVDSFSGLDAYFAEGSGDALGPGTLILTNWSANAKMSIAFESIAIWSENGGQGGGGGGSAGAECAAQSDFNDVAVAFSPCAGQCHNGQNAGATGALDMRDLDNDAGLACIQIRNRVDLANPNNSQIFINTDPNGGAGHPFKFNGNAANWNDFKDTVTGWITAEAAAN